jgi:hypothetical protein
MDNDVATKVFEAIEALKNAAVNSKLKSNIQNLVRQQKVFLPETLQEEEYVMSLLLQLLIDNCIKFSSSIGMLPNILLKL